jgi:hypothetical protein
MKRILFISALVVFGCAHHSQPTFAPCDFDQDGTVSLNDLEHQRKSFNTASTLYDVDGDGIVLGTDIVTCNEAS